MSKGGPRLTFALIIGLIGSACLLSAVFMLERARSGVAVEATTVGTIPARIYRPAGPAGPAVVVAHGFAGSQELMESFALALARNGYVAVTFDFAGHARNPAPLAGSITETTGATRTLVDETRRVLETARKLGDGRVAVLGHSMASDIVVRTATETSDVAATVAVSMFSPAVTARNPRNLLVVVGGWEGGLTREALRAVGLATAPAVAEPGRTYGSFADGTARRVAVVPGVEHVSVLFAVEGLVETVRWLDGAFGIARAASPDVPARGVWLLVLLAGIALTAYPLTRLMPVAAVFPTGAGLPWRRLWVPVVVPMIVTPIALRFVPTHFLPVLVADYLAVHFFAYGAITALCLAWASRTDGGDRPPTDLLALAAGTFLLVAYCALALVIPLDRYITSFIPGPERWPLVAAMAAGTVVYFLANEWATRGPGTGRFAYLTTKVAFLTSLAIAVALDFERLFFLVIIVPLIVLSFIVFGLVARWSYRRCGHPVPGALTSAIAFAWAIAVTFPLLAA
jgi:pimeloyl-ACP methyl ester carboxylesterase